MNALHVVEALESAGFRVFVQHDIAVIAERAVPGCAHSFRAVIAQENADGTWRFRMTRKVPGRQMTRQVYDYLPQRGPDGLPLQHLALRDPLELCLWLGGAASVPFGPEEVAAIQRGEMSVVA